MVKKMEEKEDISPDSVATKTFIYTSVTFILFIIAAFKFGM
ncbi:MAG: hypothetical protein ACI86H_000781 [bacterium]|jgi:hypothetical protein